MKKYVLAVLMILTFTASYAMMQEETPDLMSQIVPLLNSVAVWLAVKGTTAIKKIAPAWILGILVPGFSTLGAWIATKISPDSSFVMTLLLGLGSTFINEAIKRLSGTPA